MTLQDQDLTNAEIGNTSTATPAESTQGAQPVPGAEDHKPTIPPEGEAPAEEAQSPEQQEAKKQSKFQRRLDRQKTARVAAETEARLLRERVQQLETQGKPQDQGTVEPKREDFQDYEAYLRAAAKHDARQETEAALKAEREATQGRERQAQGQVRNERIAKDWTERERTFEAATKDYAEVVNPFVDDEMQHFSGGARAAIAESEVGPALLYYLSTHEEDAERISGLSAMRQVAELGKLEMKVSMPAKRTVSQAPAPASVISGGKTSTKDLNKMSQAEYEAHRKAQGARWAR